MLGFTVKTLEHIPTVGERLKNAREAMGVDLEQAAKNLKIRTVYLKNLEADDYEKMPADIYTKGFIAKYALFLNIDASAIFADYEKERKGKLLKNDKGPAELPSIKKPVIDITSKNLIRVFTAFIFLLAGGYFIYQLIFLFKSPKITLNEPIADLVTNNLELTFKGRVELNSNLTINGQEIYIDKEGNFNEEIILHDGLNVIELTAKNMFGKSVSIIRRIIRE